MQTKMSSSHFTDWNTILPSRSNERVWTAATHLSEMLSSTLPSESATKTFDYIIFSEPVAFLIFYHYSRHGFRNMISEIFQKLPFKMTDMRCSSFFIIVKSSLSPHKRLLIFIPRKVLLDSPDYRLYDDKQIFFKLFAFIPNPYGFSPSQISTGMSEENFL